MQCCIKAKSNEMNELSRHAKVSVLVDRNYFGFSYRILSAKFIKWKYKRSESFYFTPWNVCFFTLLKMKK